MKNIFFYLIMITGIAGWLSVVQGCQEKAPPVAPPVVVQDTVAPVANQWYCTPIAPIPTSGAVAQKGKFWTTGQTIKIGFPFGGTETQKNAVKQAYADWAKSANLKFEYPAAGPWNIRVSFSPGSAWSYIGVDCNSVSAAYPTLNYGFGGMETIWHEAGHSLGLLHEQQLAGGICWNEANVIADLSQPPNSWSVATIRFNVLDYHNPANIITSGYDQESIMHYSIKASWTCNNKAIAGGTKISDKDKSFAAQIYPGVGPVSPPIGTVTISKTTRDNIVRLEGLSVTYVNLAKVYADSALLVTKKATGL